MRMVSRVERWAYLVMIAFVLPVVSSAQAAQPFAGNWQGGPATCEEPFAFTDTTYRPPGGDVEKILKVTRKGKGKSTLYELRFKDNYIITLSSVTANEMGWFSAASGDNFNLTRCK